VLPIGLSKRSSLHHFKYNNMLNQIHYEPILSVYPDKTTLSYQPTTTFRSRKGISLNSLSNLKKRVTKGRISPNVTKKINNQINWLMLYTKSKKAYNYKSRKEFNFKLNFVTLTLPSEQIHCDKEIKRKCLDAFLIQAKRKWKLKDYVWRAEAQQNGNIHFHIVSDAFIPYMELRTEWNRIIDKLGYVERFAKNNNPNSTDIHSLAKIKNIGAYLSKYCSKNSKTARPIMGALWGSSERLKKTEPCRISCAGQIHDKVKELVNTNQVRSYVDERCFVMYVEVKRLMKLVPKVKNHIRDHYNKYLSNFVTNINPKIEEKCLKLSKNLLPNIQLKPLQLGLGF
tara:strand:- start:529 stop:1551 length:1023 start_codon:yes stop_codon:yes gene_type:complete